MIRYQFLQTNMIRIVWQSVRRTTNENVGVNFKRNNTEILSVGFKEFYDIALLSIFSNVMTVHVLFQEIS